MCRSKDLGIGQIQIRLRKEKADDQFKGRKRKATGTRNLGDPNHQATMQFHVCSTDLDTELTPSISDPAKTSKDMKVLVHAVHAPGTPPPHPLFAVAPAPEALYSALFRTCGPEPLGHTASPNVFCSFQGNMYPAKIRLDTKITARKSSWEPKNQNCRFASGNGVAARNGSIRRFPTEARTTLRSSQKQAFCVLSEDPFPSRFS